MDHERRCEGGSDRLPLAHPEVRRSEGGIPLCSGRSADQMMAVAERVGAVPYDIPGVELGHVEGRCSFESIMVRYGLTEDPGLVELARIVHAADVDEDIDSSPEGRGLQAIAKGFSLLHGRDDHRKIALESPMYDALYAFCLERAKRKAA